MKLNATPDIQLRDCKLLLKTMKPMRYKRSAGPIEEVNRGDSPSAPAWLGRDNIVLKKGKWIVSSTSKDCIWGNVGNALSFWSDD